jgi:opacity protein-like surface antigen
MKRYILIVLFSLLLTVAKGQSYTEVYLNFLPSVPFGETADYTSGISPRGIDFEANRFIGDDMSVGINVAWIIFREKVSPELFQINDLDVYGTQFRYQNMVPMDINFKKYFINGDYTPYVGIGAGIQFVEKRNDIGVFSLTDDKWVFHTAPEIGVLYDISAVTTLSVKAKYNYSPKSGDFPATSYLSIGLGIGF